VKERMGAMKKSGPQNRPKRMSRGRPFERGNRIGAATRFHKGQSGNPGGRPSYKEISAALRSFLALPVGTPIIPKTNAEVVAWRWLKLAKKGNLAAARELTNRVEGLPRLTAEVIGHDPLLDLIAEMKRASKNLPPVEEWVDDDTPKLQPAN
jgi:Family of unknown function (DUF5681)